MPHRINTRDWVQLTLQTEGATVAPQEEEQEEPEEETPTCETCVQSEDDCRCITCERCDVRYDTEDGYSHCDCETCDRCGETYNPPHSCCRCVTCDCCDNPYDPEVGPACDCWYCEHCDSTFRAGRQCDCEPENGGLRDYNERAEDILSFYPPRGNKNQALLYLGVELEIECKRDQETTMNDLRDSGELDQWVIGKSDGSLTEGVEIVTAPSVLKVHQTHWTNVLEKVKRHAESWNRSSTGIHVHLSRAFFSQFEIAKFVLFVNAEENLPFIVGLAGRTSPDYAALCKKRGCDVLDRSERYAAVNLKPRNTIEVRIFKGTLNEQHLLADIEFCHALANWVKVNSLAECSDWGAFMRYVSQKCYAKRYANLIAYMAKIQPKIDKRVRELGCKALKNGIYRWDEMDSDVAVNA